VLFLFLSLGCMRLPGAGMQFLQRVVVSCNYFYFRCRIVLNT
jgi:hypothetical protein